LTRIKKYVIFVRLSVDSPQKGPTQANKHSVPVEGKDLILALEDWGVKKN